MHYGNRWRLLISSHSINEDKYISTYHINNKIVLLFQHLSNPTIQQKPVQLQWYLPMQKVHMKSWKWRISFHSCKYRVRSSSSRRPHPTQWPSFVFPFPYTATYVVRSQMCESTLLQNLWQAQMKILKWFRFKNTVCASWQILLKKLKVLHKKGHTDNDIFLKNSSDSLAVILRSSMAILPTGRSEKLIKLSLLALSRQLSVIVFAIMHLCFCISSIVFEHRTQCLFSDKPCWIPIMSISTGISQRKYGRVWKQLGSKMLLVLA